MTKPTPTEWAKIVAQLGVPTVLLLGLLWFAGRPLVAAHASYLEQTASRIGRLEEAIAETSRQSQANIGTLQTLIIQTAAVESAHHKEAREHWTSDRQFWEAHLKSQEAQTATLTAIAEKLNGGKSVKPKP